MKLFIQKSYETSRPSSLLIKQESLTNKQDIAEHLNNFFTSHFSDKKTLCKISKNPKQKSFFSKNYQPRGNM